MDLTRLSSSVFLDALVPTVIDHAALREVSSAQRFYIFVPTVITSLILMRALFEIFDVTIIMMALH
eukprot:scaffold6493_cov110-Skeletonema_dohrnii-CCMP3373.AAC.3